MKNSRSEGTIETAGGGGKKTGVWGKKFMTGKAKLGGASVGRLKYINSMGISETSAARLTPISGFLDVPAASSLVALFIAR